MPINKVDYTSAIDALEAAYNLNWFPTNFGATGAPQLPAGMVIPILGFPYVVAGGDVLPSGSPSDGLVYIKVTPNIADGGLTADAEYTNTFSGSWNAAYNGWYDGNSFFLNFFCTKAGANYNGKGFWLNWRERKLTQISGSLNIDGNISSVDASISGNLSIGSYITSDLGLDIIMLAGTEKFKIDTVTVDHTGDLNWFKMKEYKVYGHGSVRVKFTVDVAPSGNNRVTNAAIYVNGVLSGIDHVINTSSSAISHDTFTEDIPINRGDMVQVYIKLNSSVHYSVSVSLVELSCNKALSNLALDYVVE